MILRFLTELKKCRIFQGKSDIIYKWYCAFCDFLLESFLKSYLKGNYLRLLLIVSLNICQSHNIKKFLKNEKFTQEKKFPGLDALKKPFREIKITKYIMQFYSKKKIIIR